MPGIMSIIVLGLALLAGKPAARSGALTARGTLSSDYLIGYTELRTNLPGGRHANVTTMRARVVKADGTNRRLLGEELARESDAWTQFAGWAPDGKTAV